MPCRGPRQRPAFTSASAVRATARALSRATVMNTFRCGLSASIRARHVSSRAMGETACSRIRVLTSAIVASSSIIESPLAHLHPIGNNKRRPVASVAVREEMIGFFVVDDLLRFGIHAQRPAETIRRVGQMDERARYVALFDGRRQVGRLSTAHAADEVGEVIAAGAAAGTGPLIGAKPALV